MTEKYPPQRESQARKRDERMDKWIDGAWARSSTTNPKIYSSIYPSSCRPKGHQRQPAAIRAGSRHGRELRVAAWTISAARCICRCGRSAQFLRLNATLLQKSLNLGLQSTPRASFRFARRRAVVWTERQGRLAQVQQHAPRELAEILLRQQ